MELIMGHAADTIPTHLATRTVSKPGLLKGTGRCEYWWRPVRARQDLRSFGTAALRLVARRASRRVREPRSDCGLGRGRSRNVATGTTGVGDIPGRHPWVIDAAHLVCDF